MRVVFISKRIFTSVAVLFISVNTLLFANPTGEKTISSASIIGPATVTTNLTMFSEATIVRNVMPSGTIRGVTLVTFSHNKSDYSSGVASMRSKYKIEDTLYGIYRISNVRFNVINSSSAIVNIDIESGGNSIKIEVNDYLADDANRAAVIEIIGDIDYIQKKGELGKGTVVVGNIIEATSYHLVMVSLNSPIEVRNAITLNTQPLNFGNVVPLTGKYEKESLIDITGAKGTDVTISINGVVAQEVNEELINGRDKIPITYRIENGRGNMISDLNLGASGIGNAVLKGTINSDNIPRGQVGGSYTGSVTIEVDYK